MESIRTQVEYRGKVYLGDADEFTENGKEILKSLIDKACKGQVNYISIESNGKEHYFSENVLKECVITLIYE